jgi:fatty-acyl-CoA synthase
MRDEGLGSWIERRARFAPEHIALISGEKARSYRELACRVRRLAHGLRGMGVRQGDRVGWLGANHPAFLETLFASASLGAVLSPVNHRLDSGSIGRILEDSGSEVVVMEGRLATLPLPPIVRSRVVVGGGGEGTIEYERLAAESPDKVIDEQIGLGDLCLLPHTSGTTGAPKGVMLTHGNIIWNVVNFLSCVDFRSDEYHDCHRPAFPGGWNRSERVARPVQGRHGRCSGEL